MLFLCAFPIRAGDFCPGRVLLFVIDLDQYPSTVLVYPPDLRTSARQSST